MITLREFLLKLQEFPEEALDNAVNISCEPDSYDPQIGVRFMGELDDFFVVDNQLTLCFMGERNYTDDQLNHLCNLYRQDYESEYWINA